MAQISLLKVPINQTLCCSTVENFSSIIFLRVYLKNGEAKSKSIKKANISYTKMVYEEGAKIELLVLSSLPTTVNEELATEVISSTST